MEQVTIDSMLNKSGNSERNARSGFSQAQFHLSIGQRNLISAMVRGGGVVSESLFKKYLKVHAAAELFALGGRGATTTTGNSVRSLASTYTSASRFGGHFRPVRMMRCAKDGTAAPGPASYRSNGERGGSGVETSLRQTHTSEAGIEKRRTACKSNVNGHHSGQQKPKQMVISCGQMLTSIGVMNRGLAAVGSKRLVRVYSRWDDMFYVVYGGASGDFTEYRDDAAATEEVRNWLPAVVCLLKQELVSSAEGCIGVKKFGRALLRDVDGLRQRVLSELFSYIVSKRYFRACRFDGEESALQFFFGPVLLALDEEVMEWSTRMGHDEPGLPMTTWFESCDGRDGV